MAEEKRGSALHLESDVVETTTRRNASISATADDAQTATAKENSMTLWQGIKTYPRAIGWSVLLSTAIVMEGYDVVLMASFYGFPAFTQKYGVLQPDGSYQVEASWQTGLSTAMNVGQILGLFANGIIAERFGYRKTMLGALTSVVGFIFILFFAEDKPTLLAGEILMGIPLGVFQTLTVTYASEVCPVVLRAYLTTYVNLCWVMGQLIASGVLKGLLNLHSQWAYRIPFAVQWAWPLPIIVGVILAPEGPWWLVRQDRIEEAKTSLRRLASRGVDGNEMKVDETIAMMIHTNELEKEINAGTSYLDCFRGVDLRRTEVVCFTWAVQNLCGSGLMGYSTFFYQMAGLPTEQSFNMSLAQYALGFFGTLFSWILMRYFGRRTLYVSGLAMLAVLLFIVGFTTFAGSGKPDHKAASWAAGSMLLVYTFVYDSTVGPVCYSLVSELSSTRLRNKTIVLARNLYNVFGIVNGVLIPYMINSTAWNWSTKTGFFFGGLCLCCLAWAYFRLPEPKGRTYGELDVLFERKVSARRFATTVVDPFHARAEAGLSSDEEFEKSRTV